MKLVYFRLRLLPLLLTCCAPADGLTIDCEVFEDNFDQTAETTVAVGEQFTLTLCSKRHRGYRWSEEGYIDDPQVVQELSREYETRRSPMGGIPGLEHWTFQALKPGKAIISLEHTQLSGRNTLGVYTYRLDVTVQPPAK